MRPDLPADLTTLASPFDFATTVARLEASIAARGLTLIADIDHAAAAERVGLALRPTRVLIFGNPRGGTPLMVAAPLIALDLPLKALIWRDETDHTWVSYVGGGALAQRYGLAAELAQPIAGLDDLIAAALRD